MTEVDTKALIALAFESPCEVARLAAAVLRVSKKTIYRLRRAGQIAYIPGPPVRIPAAEINRYVEAVTCRDRTGGLASSRTPKASTKSAGPKTAAPSASARARRMLLKRRIFSARGAAA